MSQSKIKAFRKLRGMTLQQLADQVGSSKAYMWSLENKENPQPSVGLAWRISEALNAPIYGLFDVTIPKPAEGGVRDGHKISD